MCILAVTFLIDKESKPMTIAYKTLKKSLPIGIFSATFLVALTNQPSSAFTVEFPVNPVPIGAFNKWVPQESYTLGGNVNWTVDLNPAFIPRISAEDERTAFLKFLQDSNYGKAVADGGLGWTFNLKPVDTLKGTFNIQNYYQTLLASDGPRYQEGELQLLGQLWDSEKDGQPTPLADGDDINGGCQDCNIDPIDPDDEDGVIFGDSWVDVTFNISRPDPNPYQLRAWWDTNYNGVFDHTSELYIDDLLTLAPGIFTKRYNLGFNPKADGLYSRFRLTWDPLDLDVKPFGEYYSKADCNTTDAAAGNCVSHGEVEDYAPIPEPSSIFGLLAFGGLGLMGLRKKR